MSASSRTPLQLISTSRVSQIGQTDFRTIFALITGRHLAHSLLWQSLVLRLLPHGQGPLRPATLIASVVMVADRWPSSRQLARRWSR